MVSLTLCLHGFLHRAGPVTNAIRGRSGCFFNSHIGLIFAASVVNEYGLIGLDNVETGQSSSISRGFVRACFPVFASLSNGTIDFSTRFRAVGLHYLQISTQVDYKH